MYSNQAVCIAQEPQIANSLSSIEHRSVKGTALGFLSFCITVVHSIVLVPFFLTYWGETKYGQFLGVYAFIQLLRTLDSGHQVFIGNKFNLYYYQDQQKAYHTLASSILIAFLIGFIEFVIFIGLWFSGVLDKFLGLDITVDSGLAIGISSMLIMWWLVGSVGGILVKAVMARGLFAQATIFAILIKLLEVLLIGMAIILELSLASVFIALAILNLIFSLVVLYWVYLKMPEFYPWWKGWNLKTGISNLVKSVVFTINGFLEQLNSNGLIFIISSYLSVAMVPVFTTLRTLTNTMSMVTNIFIQPLVPEMVRYHSQDNKTKIIRVIQVNWLFSGAIVNLGFLLLIPVAGILYKFWTNDKLEFNEGFFYLLILSVILYNYGRGLTSYLTGINDLKSISVITWTKSIILFIVSIAGIKYFGIVSIGLAAFLSELVGSVLLPNWFLKSHLRPEINVDRSLWVYSLPILTMIGIVSLCYLFGSYKYMFGAFGLIAISILYYYQWLRLDFEIKMRITGLAATYKQKLIRR